MLFRSGVGGGAPAVAQATKMGHVFLLHRETGEPLYPVEERSVPGGGVKGEMLSPTQPFPTHPPPLHPTSLTPDDAWGFTFIDRRDCAEKLASWRSEGIFTPPSLQGSVQYPGSAGGPNWGGVAIDPVNGVLFINQIRMALVSTLIPRKQYDQLDTSEVVYPDELYPMQGTPYGVTPAAVLPSSGVPSNPPPVVISWRPSGTSVAIGGFTSPAMETISSVAAISRLSLTWTSSASLVRSRSCMCRRSSRR